MILFTKNENEMNELREQIKGIDYSIMTLVAQRISLARRIGVIKEKEGLPVRNYQIERQVYDRISNYSDDFEINTDFSKRIFRVIVEQSVRQQVTDRDVIPMNSKSLRCLIIGGAGRMGQWFEHFLQTSGHHIEIMDPNKGVGVHYHNLDSVELDLYDLIIVASPLRIMNQVLAQVVEKKPRGVILEISSIKAKVIPIIKSVDNELTVLAIHPMFGPDTPYLNQKNIICCVTENTSQRAVEMFNYLFRGTMANLVEVELDLHDEYMNLSIGLSHLINLIMGISLAKSKIPYETLMQFAGNTLRKQLGTTKDFFTKNTALFHEIQHSNPCRENLFTLVSGVIQDLSKVAALNNSKDFSSLMNLGNTYFHNL